MSPTPTGAVPVADMLRQLRGQGISVAELGRMLDRSPRMVNKILRGETPGEAYRGAVTELYERGQVRTPPPRRRGADGRPVAVRAPGGGLKTPEAPKRRRGRFAEQMTPLAEGARQYQFEAPRTRNAVQRGEANRVIVSRLRSAAKGQRWDRKKVKFVVTWSNGHSMEVGSKHGYKVSTVLRRARGFEGDFSSDALGWLKTQAQHRYPDIGKAGVVITDVTMTVYNHRDEGQY